ncbi:MAG TPA: hypothetical protein VJ548_05415 [Azospira sp.]|nr:hypothetical protein [Azospira sp.]
MERLNLRGLTARSTLSTLFVLLSCLAATGARADSACGLLEMREVFDALPAVAQRFPEAGEIGGEAYRQLAVAPPEASADGLAMAALVDARDGRAWLLRYGDGAFDWFGPVMVNDPAFLAGCPAAPLPADYRRPRDIAAFEILNLDPDPLPGSGPASNPAPAPAASSGDAGPR